MSAPTTETVAPAARTRIDPRGPRFAATLTTLVLAAALLLAPSAATVTLLAVQLVVFAVVALLGYVAGVDLLGAVATGLALAAAFLNAAFGFCLGCEVYLLLQRLRPART